VQHELLIVRIRLTIHQKAVELTVGARLLLEHHLDGFRRRPSRRRLAVFVTWDEAGGYWDSGFVQVLDFFGDGPRMPLLVLSPYSTGGKINHSYADHVSLDKFIERNWRLRPNSTRSRDNLPNPKVKPNNPYVPTNMPALGDLFDSFDFSKQPNNQPYYQ
jgi:phospholipase C